MRFAALPLVLCFVLPTVVSAQNVSADGAAQTFSTYTQQYFDDYFKLNPTAGTSAGLHQYDTQLEDYSAAGIEHEVSVLKVWQKKLATIDPAALDAEPAADYLILSNSIRSQLLTLEVIRPWEKNPDNYSSGLAGSIFSIMERPYAPANVRLRAVVEREKMIPQVLLRLRWSRLMDQLTSSPRMFPAPSPTPPMRRPRPNSNKRTPPPLPRSRTTARG
jgi:uncharacterized protein (DUF885 family)